MEDYFKFMLFLARDAGETALKFIEGSQPELKADTSVITKADRAISALAHERLAPYLEQTEGGHLLIDEEDPKRGEYLDQGLLQKTPFLWSIDPIDATRAYANRMPHYGISVGLIKDLRPWLGVVYFPSLKELFCCDGADAWFVRDPFSDVEERMKIVPVDEKITSRSVFIATDDFLDDFQWRSDDCRVMIFSAAVCEFCWPAIGRGCGSLSKVHLWDMAGAWPVFEKAGLRMRSFETGRVLDKVDAGLFEKGETPWRLQDLYILSSERNYPLLKSRLVSR